MMKSKTAWNISKTWIIIILGLFLSLSFSHIAHAMSPMLSMPHADMSSQDCFSNCAETPVQNSCLEHCLGDLEIISVDSLQTPQRIDQPVFVPVTSEPLVQPKAETAPKPELSDPPPRTSQILKTQQRE